MQYMLLIYGNDTEWEQRSDEEKAAIYDEYRVVSESSGIKAGAIVGTLKDEFGLGHGHAMAIVALLKGKKVQAG